MLRKLLEIIQSAYGLLYQQKNRLKLLAAVGFLLFYLFCEAGGKQSLKWNRPLSSSPTAAQNLAQVSLLGEPCNIQAPHALQGRIVGLFSYCGKEAVLVQFDQEGAPVFNILSPSNATGLFNLVRIEPEAIWFKPFESRAHSKKLSPHSIYRCKVGQNLSEAQIFKEDELPDGCTPKSKKTQNFIALKDAPLPQLLALFKTCGLTLYTLDDFSFSEEILFTLALRQSDDERLFKRELLQLFRLTESQPCSPPHLSLTSAVHCERKEQSHARISLQHLSLFEEGELLKKELQTKLSASAKLLFNPIQNEVEMRDDREHLLQAFAWLVQKDRPTLQFCLNGSIFFCAEESAEHFGFDLCSLLSAATTATASKPIARTSRARNAASTARFSASTLQGLQKAALEQCLKQLEIEEKVRVLSRPKLIVRNHQRACLEQHRSIHSPSFTAKATKKPSKSQPHPDLTFKFEILPIALSAEQILIKLSLTQATPTRAHLNQEIDQSEKIPAFVNHLETELVVRFNEPVVLGGLFEQERCEWESRPYLLKWLPLNWFEPRGSRTKDRMLLLCFSIEKYELGSLGPHEHTIESEDCFLD